MTTTLSSGGNATITTIAQLNDVINQADSAAANSGAYEIDLGHNVVIALTTGLYAINLKAGVTLDIKGNGATIDGENEATQQSYNQRGFFVYSGVVTLENMTIANTVARGGDGGGGLGGGGGGGGLGGGLFIANDSGSAVAGQVTLSGVSFSANSAVGGRGGDGSDGYTTVVNSFMPGPGGGGGLGQSGTDGYVTGDNISGYHTFAGTGGGSGVAGLPGTTLGTGGNGAYNYNLDSSIAAGGFGGGGGGGSAQDIDFPGIGGLGGFGGGGGGGAGLHYSFQTGITTFDPTAGSVFGGGQGEVGGGGGLAAGADIFAQAGTSLTINGGSSLSAGTVTGGGGGADNGTIFNLQGGTGAAYGSGIFIQSGSVTLGSGQTAGQVTEIDGSIADVTGSHDVSGLQGLGFLVISGAGKVLLTAANTYAGGTTILGGTLELAQASSAGTGAIALTGAGVTLRIDATPVNGSTFVPTLSTIDISDRIDLRGLAFVAGATAIVEGTTLTVTSGAVSEHFTLANSGSLAFAATSDGAAGTPGVLLTPLAAQTVSGTLANQATTSEAPIHPFGGITIADPNAGATDSVTITMSGYGGVLSGVGLSGGANGVYTLAAATPAVITTEMKDLVFTPTAGAPNAAWTTSFDVAVHNSLGATVIDHATSVIDTDPAVAPVIGGSVANQITHLEAPTTPFAGVTISDSNYLATDTVTITMSGGSGTLTGTGLSASNGVYTLSGSLATIVSELHGLVFTPDLAPSGTSTPTTFTITAASSAGTSAADSITTVVDVVPAVRILSSNGHATVSTLAELNDVLTQAAYVPANYGKLEIDIAAGSTIDISAGSGLDAVNLQAGVTLDVKGHGATLDGHNQRQGLFVYSGQVTFEDLTVANTLAKGGNGVGSGGGGAGLGGGLFVASGGNVVLSDVNFSNTAAVGGDTAFIRTPGHGIPGNTSPGRDGNGGGGGLDGGTGGTPAGYDFNILHGNINDFGASGGGGGGGVGARGGGSAANGAAGIVPNAPGGTVGLGPTAGSGGTNGGGGGGGVGFNGGSASGGFGGGGGGIGAGQVTAHQLVLDSGINGGFGGGGGGSGGNPDAWGGDGGFGGGGGGASFFGGGTGGFGGGGGGALVAPGYGGFGAGDAIDVGGGGLAAGGVIFAEDGAQITIVGSTQVAAGTVTGGDATGIGVGPSNLGQAFANGIYLQGSGPSLTFNTEDPTTHAATMQTISGVIGDDSGSAAAAGYFNPHANYNPGNAGLIKTGIGTLTLSAVNTYTGTTSVNAGTLIVDGSIATSHVDVASGATLGGHGTTGSVTIAAGGTLAPGNSPGIIHTGDLTFNSGGHFAVQIEGTTAGTEYDQVVVNGAVSLGGASLDLSFLNGFAGHVGDSFLLIDNDGTDAVSGQFAQGASITSGSETYSINYNGGDGNDVVLTDVAPASIGDFVWDDANLNGRQDAGEPGIAGVTVNLLDTSLHVIATTVTDGAGHYGFAGLAPGDYKVQVVTPSGYTVTNQDSAIATDATDSDADPVTGNTTTHTLGVGAADNTVDAGFYQLPSIAGLSGDAVTFIEGGSAINLDAGMNASIVDSDGTLFCWSDNFDGSAPFSSGSLRVSITSGAVAAEDVLRFDPASTVTLSNGYNAGSIVSVGGVAIGTIAAGGDGANGDDLVVTFNTGNDNATQANVATLIQATIYSNSSLDNLTAGDRTVMFTLGADRHAAATTATTTVHVATANDPPVANADTLPTIAEDAGLQSIAFATLTGNDTTGSVNESAQTLTVTGVSNAAGGSVQITGGHIEFTPTANFNGAASFDYTIQDDGTTNGIADPKSATGHASFTITAVNDAPTDVVPGAQTVTEDGTLVFSTANGNAISVADVDGGNGIETVTLFAQHGTMTLGSTAGLQSVINNASVVILTGTISQLNAALEGTTYTLAANYNGPEQLTVTIEDNGNSGTVFNALSHSDPIAITVTEVNDAPVANADTLPTIAEDAGLQTIAFATLTGNDTTGPVNESAQTLTVTGVSNAAGGSVQITGGHIEFTPTANFNGAASFDYTIQDNGTTNGIADPKSTTGHASFTITAVNDAPTATNLTQSLTFAEDAAALNLFTLAPVVADIDSASVTATLTLSNTAAGVIVGADSSVGGVYTVTGSLAHVNAALATLTFDSAQDFNGTASVAVVIDDGHNGPQGVDPSGAISITVTAVNDPPVNTVPGTLTFPAGADNVITGLSVSDVDATSLTTTLHVDHGTLNIVAAGGATVGGDGTDTLTLTGSVAQVAATLAAANNVHYHGAAGFHGADELTMTTSDGGGTGTGGALTDTDTVAIKVTAASTPLYPFDAGNNGHDDILWYRDNGTASVWDDGQINSSHVVGTGVTLDWHIVGTGDFDGNGKDDILWQRDNGSVSIWDNSQIGGAHIIANAGDVASSWHIVGTGDFDGNGKGDILWQNDNGAISIWDNGQINGGHIVSGAGNVASSWHIVGTGDFDGNGHSDILWQNDNGAVSIWDNGQINSAHIVSAAGNVASSWHIAGTGDFDGNGHSDILWQNDNGAVSIWDNGQIGGGHIIVAAGAVASDWHIAGTGDFDGNGKTDILWHRDNGMVSIWDNAQIAQAHVVATIPNDWHIV